jgi:hypothetical protein
LQRVSSRTRPSREPECAKRRRHARIALRAPCACWRPQACAACAGDASEPGQTVCRGSSFWCPTRRAQHTRSLTPRARLRVRQTLPPSCWRKRKHAEPHSARGATLP